MYNYNKETIASTYLRAQLCIEAFVCNVRQREESLERCLTASCRNTHKIICHCIQMFKKKNILPKKLITIVLDL